MRTVAHPAPASRSTWRKAACARQLEAELSSLVRFKTSTLVDTGFKRNGVRGSETASQTSEHLGLLSGAMMDQPKGRVIGLGIPGPRLTFGLLVFRAAWGWYVQRRKKTRRFSMKREVDVLRSALALARKDFRCLRQTPPVAQGPGVIPGLISSTEIEEVRRVWDLSGDLLYSVRAPGDRQPVAR